MHTSELTASARALGSVPVGGHVATASSHASHASPLRNRAGEAVSPFVKSYADSPVAWQALDNVTVELAKKEHKLVFIHIGYKACHHCRLMAQESFSNPEVASLLNEFFVPILIDRDERPDLDVIYMNYVQAVSSSGGWPLNLFLTPNLEPVFGGTFWPGPGSVRRLQTETGEEVMDFLSIVQKVGKTWRDQEARCRKEATEVVGQLREFAAEGVLGTRGITSAPLAPQTSSTTPAAHEAASATHTGVSKASELDLDQLEEAYTHIAGTFDPVYGGFGLAPKFPTPPKLAFLLRLKEFPSEVQDVVGTQECQHAQDMALDTLRKMAKSALRDHIGGTSFCRCSVTPDWSIPNFEKMVVDNALLLTLYLDAWRLSGGKEDSEFFDVVLELVDYLITAPVALPEGGFASGEAADSFYKRGDREMREGAYYLWTKREFDSVVDVDDKLASQVVGAYYGIMEDGNVDEGHDPNDDFISENIVRIRASPEELGKHFGIPVDTVRKLISNAKDALRAKREKERVRPEVDDKVVTGWTSLVISSLARAGIALKDVRPLESDKCLVTAKKASVFVKEKLWDSETGVLARIYKNGKGGEGFADDYAYTILGLLDLFDATGDESLVEFAEKVHERQVALFYDPSGAYYTTTPSSPHAIIRLKDGMDTSLPSTNAVSVSNLFRLSGLLGDKRYELLAHQTLDAFEAEVLQHPWLFPGILAGVVTARLGASKPVRELSARRQG